MAHRSQYSPEIINKAKKMYLKGVSFKEIAKELRIGSHNTVVRWANDGNWDELFRKSMDKAEKSIQNEFIEEITTYKRSKVRFVLKMFADMATKYHDGVRDFEDLKCNKITTEILANIDSCLASVISLDDVNTASAAHDFVETVRAGETVEDIFDDELSEEDGDRNRKAV